MTDVAQLVRKQSTDAEVKALGDGLFEAVISTETVDRDGDVVMANGARTDNYMKNPVVMWAHDYGSFPIGKARSVDAGRGKVKATFEFAPTPDGQTARTLWEGGYLSATSIGFMPLVYESEHREDGSEGYRFTEWELLEFSIVPIPANPEALRRQLVRSLKEYAAFDDVPAVLRDLADAVARGAIGSHHTPTADDTWDGPAAMAACDAKASALRKLCAWVDSNGDPEKKGSYKFPHHNVSGGTPGPANLGGCRNGLARVGNASIPDGDRAGVSRHLQTHLDDAKSFAPDESPDPASLVREAMAEGDLEAVGSLVGTLAARIADAETSLAAAREDYDEKAQEAEGLTKRLDEYTALAEQVAAPEQSPARSVLIEQDTARIAARAVSELMRRLTGKLPD